VTTATATLTIGRDADGQPFSLPAEVLTRHMAILAKRGAGKTYTAGVIEEEFAKAGLPFVVLDPVGVHYGIRSDKKGRRSAYPVIVFGGEHADIPIERHMGRAIAQAVVEENISCIVDLTELSKAAWRQFVAEFCRELYQLNRTPRHVFIEEATEFVPQTRRPEMQVAYEAVERLVRMGRNRGIGCTLISQRSAQVAKDVLTQMDVLIALRTVGVQDRKALLDMFESVLEEDELVHLEAFKRDIVRLPDGTAWIWSPEFMKTFTQVHIRERETYHAGATPAFGDVKVVQARPDVRELKARFAAAAEPEPTPKGTTAAQCKGHVERIGQLEDALVAAQAEVQRWKGAAEDVRAELDPLRESVARLQRQVNGVDSLRTGLLALLGDSADAGGAVAAIDEDALLERLTARLPAGSAPVVQVTPPEALRKQYLQVAADRLMAKIPGAGDGRTVMELLLGQEVFWSINRMSKALTGNDSGGTRTRWGNAVKELATVGLVVKGGSGRSEYRANVRGCVEVELAPHGGTPEEITAVERQVLYRLTSEMGEKEA